MAASAAEQVVLTAAELSYLISSSPAPTRLGVRAAEAIGLTGAERSESVIATGFSSLIARGLAVSDGTLVTLAPSTSSVSDAITQARVNVQIGLVAAERSDGGLLFESSRVRVLVSPRRHRCFDVTGLNHHADLPEQLLTITREFFQRHRPGVVTMVVDTAGHGQPEDLGWATVAADAERWSVVFSQEPSDAHRGIGEEQAVQRMRERLGELLQGAGRMG